MKPNSHSHYHQLPATPQGFHVLSRNYLLSGYPTIQQKKKKKVAILLSIIKNCYKRKQLELKILTLSHNHHHPIFSLSKLSPVLKLFSPWFLVQQISCANGKAELTSIHYKFDTSNLCQSLDTITITKLYSNQPFINSFGDSITSFSIIRVCFLQFFDGIFFYCNCYVLKFD